MRITIFKIFIWGGVSSVIGSEISFYGSTDEISDHITDDIPPQTACERSQTSGCKGPFYPELSH